MARIPIMIFKSSIFVKLTICGQFYHWIILTIFISSSYIYHVPESPFSRSVPTRRRCQNRGWRLEGKCGDEDGDDDSRYLWFSDL